MDVFGEFKKLDHPAQAMSDEDRRLRAGFDLDKGRGPGQRVLLQKGREFDERRRLTDRSPGQPAAMEARDLSADGIGALGIPAEGMEVFRRTYGRALKNLLPDRP
jgi:hypothetical protein